MTPRSRPARPSGAPLRFGATAALSKDEVFALCCTLAEVERLLERTEPALGAAAADAREQLEARLVVEAQSAAGSGSNRKASEFTQ